MIRAFLVYSLALTGTSLAGPLSFSSPKEQVHLLELYSTQSCSSCPPAQKWISKLMGKKGLWTKFVPIVMHVDYWDYLGWKDPYSDPVFTKRQRSYGKIWRAKSIYTPEFALDGREWRARDPSHLTRSTEKVGVLSVRQVTQTKYTVTFAPSSRPKGPMVVHGVITKSRVKTKVKAGENQGRTLTHDFLVTDYSDSIMKQAKGAYQATIALPRATASNHPTRLVFWVSDQKSMQPIQVASTDLRTKPEKKSP